MTTFMNQLPVIFMLVMLVITIVYSYSLSRARHKLTYEQKTQLRELNESARGFGIDIILLFVVPALISSLLIFKLVSSNVIIALLICWSIALIGLFFYDLKRTVSKYRKLKKFGFPNNFLNTIIINNLIIYLTIVFFIILITYNNFYLESFS